MMKKKGEVVSSKTVVIILAILIFILIAWFLFKGDINKYLRNLPGFSYDSTDKDEDYTGKEGTTINSCNYRVARIREGNIYFCKNGVCSSSDIKSFILLDLDTNKITLDINWGWDKTLGVISNNQIKLVSEALDMQNKLYKELSEKGISYEQLINLDGSKIVSSGGIFLCRDRQLGGE